MENYFQVVQEYLNCGLSVIPVNVEKVPIGEWKQYQTSFNRPENFNRNSHGIAVVCGSISGRLECLDVDTKHDATGKLWDEFKTEIDAQLVDFSKNVVIERTVSGGYHLIYRVDGEVGGNQKLAKNEKKEVLLETRGEGGYFVCAPTPNYSFTQHNFSKIPAISQEERDMLFEIARSFDCIDAKEERVKYIPKGFQGEGLTPNDDYDSRVDNILSELEGAGWTSRQGYNGVYYLTRPGKTKGVSATISQPNRAGLANRFYLFSSSVGEIPIGKLLKPSAVYAYLRHNGDFTESAKDLYQKGFGERMEKDIVIEKKTEQLKSEDKLIYSKAEYNHSVIAERILEWKPNIYYIREEFYIFDGKKYDRVSEEYLETYIREFLKNVYLRTKHDVLPVNISKEAISNVRKNIELARLKDFEHNSIIGESLKGYDPSKLIVLQNGIFDLESGKLLDHNPDYFTTIALDLKYSADAECPKWQKYIESQVDPKSINLIHEWFGYNLLKHNKKSKFMVFYGVAGSGKSVALQILMSLVGKGNYSAFTFAGMSSEFGLSHYVNKQALFCGDAHLSSVSSEKYTAVLERLKAITGNDLIEINRKGLDFISVPLPLKITFNCNEIPRFNDKANALMRRLLVVNFPTVIEEKDQNENFRSELLEELPGIFNWAVQGLENLEALEKFSFIDEELKSEFRDSNNPVQAFINEYCELGEGFQVEIMELYNVWKKFCLENGYKEGSTASFGTALHSLPTARIRKIRGGNRRERKNYYSGIELRINP